MNYFGEAGSISVMDIYTGEIIAMNSSPHLIRMISYMELDLKNGEILIQII